MKSKQQEKYDEPEAASYPNAVPCLSHISLSLSLSPALPLSFSLYIWNNKSMQNLQDKYKELLDAWQQKLQGFILNDEGYKHSVSSD